MKIKHGDDYFINLRPIRKHYLYQVKGIYIFRYEIRHQYKGGQFVVCGSNGLSKHINPTRERVTSEYTTSRDTAIASVTCNIAMAYSKLLQWQNVSFDGGLFHIKYKDFHFTYDVWSEDSFEQTTKGFRTKQRYFYTASDNRPLRITEQGAYAMFIGTETDAAKFVKDIVHAEIERVNQAEEKFRAEYLTDK